MTATQISTLRPWQIEMLNVITAKPQITNEELGEIFGRSPTWVSIVRNTDAFQQLLTTRTAKRADSLDDKLEDRLAELAERGVEALHEKLDDTLLVKTSDAVNITRLALQATGNIRERPSASSPSVVNNILMVDKDDLLAARARMTGRFEEVRADRADRALNPPTAEEPTDDDGTVSDIEYFETPAG